MNWQTLVDPVFSGRLCVTLLHSLWQMALLVLVVRAVEYIWARRAETRYTIHVAALIVGLAALPVTYSLVRVNIPPKEVQNQTAGSGVPLAFTPVLVEVQPPRTAARQSRVEYTKPSPAKKVKAVPSKIVQKPPVDISQIAPWVAAAYALGVLVMLVRLGKGMWRAHRLVSNAELMEDGPLVGLLRSLVRSWSMRVVPALARSQQIAVPQIIGLVRPTILLPAAAIAGLSTSELEMVLAHELAHVRRYDMWVNLLQRLAEATLFFNPALWYLSRRASALREFCCDELTCRALAESGDETRKRYAFALLKVVELSFRASTNCRTKRLIGSSDLAALAAGGSGPSELRRRVAHLFGEELREPIRFSRGGILTILAFAVVVLVGPSLWKSAAGSAFAQAAADKATEVDKKFDFELQVVGPDGKPVPQAEVDIRSRPKPTREQIKRGEFVRRYSYGTLTKADAAGYVAFSLAKQPKQVTLLIKMPGFGLYYADWDATNHPVKIPAKFVAELDAGWTVGGIVVDSEGKPVEGVEIHPSIESKKRPGDTRQMGAGEVVKTDAAGKWSCGIVPASMSEVSVEIMHPDFMPSLRSLTRAAYGVEAGHEAVAKIVLDRGLTITGKVVDEAGKPIPGALVRTKFMNNVRETKTGDDGSYRLGGCQPKMARLVVSAKGRAMDLKEVRFEPDMAPVDFTLKPGGKIRIRVVDKQGNGIAKSRIFFQRWRGQIGYFEFDHVNGYANEKGVWEWNEAPPDSISADICPPGGMQLSEQSIIARDEEYVFRPPTALVVTGTVIDAETKQPIKVFRAIPGIRGGNDPHIDWVRGDSYAAKDGKYRIRYGRTYPGHVVRIEADGYRAAVSEEIKSDEENVIVDFELEKGANIDATILTPNGAPAAGAKIALGVPKSQISIQNGSVDGGQTYAARADADASGKFHFPPQDSKFRLIITHPTGFASIQSGADWSRTTIKLTPWARVEGTFRAGKAVVPNAGIELMENALDSYGEDVPHIFTTYYTTTGPDGRFVFERVVPGEGRIGRRIILMVTDGATEVTSSKRMPIQCNAGETTKIQLGGDGRAVVGRLTPPKDFRDKALWNFATIQLEVELPQLNPPAVPAAVQNDRTKYQAWLNEWQLTPEGRAYRVMIETNERISKASPYIWASVDRDGAFHIDDVPPGNYHLSVRFDQHAPGGLQHLRVSVPAIEAGQADEPVDLGVLTLTSN